MVIKRLINVLINSAGARDDGGGGRRSLREAVRGEEPQHLLRRDLLRPHHRRPGPQPQLLARLQRRQPQAGHPHRHRRPRLLRRPPQQPPRPPAHAAARRPGVERHAYRVRQSLATVAHPAHAVPRRRPPTAPSCCSTRRTRSAGRSSGRSTTSPSRCLTRRTSSP